MGRKKKEIVEPIVSHYYVEPTPITRDYTDLKLSRLKPNMIMSGRLTQVKLKSENIVIDKSQEDSWVYIIGVLLGVIYETNKTSFIKVLIKHRLINEYFQVTSVKPVYFDGSKESEEAKIYSIVHNQFYMIIKNKMKWVYLVSVIKVLFSIVEEDTKMVKLDIVQIK